MCGLAGYLIKNTEFEVSNHSIKKMLLLQKHRGPDDSGIVAINSKLNSFENCSFEIETKFKNPANLVFGFNRLSILDLSSNGHQPMLSADGKIVLMLNGEIYNAFDFKDELVTKGYQSKGDSDTEIVLNLYHAYGIGGMLERLNGMFAISIWDANFNKLFLIRDRFGIKPLYILEEENRLVFSSEMKSFKALSNFKFELNNDHLHEFLLFRNLVNNTLFKNIRNLTPGTYLEIQENGSYQEIQYYSLKNELKLNIPDAEAKKTLKISLQNSVKMQMLSDVKLGCQLSGGIDSTLVTTFANEFKTSNNLETISVLFENKNYSEENYIDFVTKKLNLNSHKYCLVADYYFNMIEKVTWHFEQPINHPNTIGLFLLSEKAKQHVTVLLSGEGADETLGGYSRFINFYRNPFFSKSFIQKLYFNRKNISVFFFNYLNRNNRIIIASTFVTLSSIKSILPNFKFKKAIENRKQILDDLSNSPIQNLYRKYEMATYLPDLLMRQDKMSMAHSIENRVPFLDNNFVAKALSIKNNLLIKNRKGKIETKYLLKEICASIFGDEFAYREKKGFGIPLKEFMNSSSFVELWITKIRPGIEKRKLFKMDKVDKWILNLKNAKPDQLETIWQLLTFELWAQQYLD